MFKIAPDSIASASVAALVAALLFAGAPRGDASAATPAVRVNPALIPEQAVGAAPVTGAPASATPGPSARTPAWDVTLKPEGSSRGRLTIEGRILDEGGRPRRDARVRVHHTLPGTPVCFPDDPAQKPSGVLRTNILGEYRVRTRLPGLAEGIPHVHFEFDGPDGSIRAIALRLGRAEGPGSDSSYARLPWMSRLVDKSYWGLVSRDSAGDYHCRWDLQMSKLLNLPPEEVAGRK